MAEYFLGFSSRSPDKFFDSAHVATASTNKNGKVVRVLN
jgi:hypothetical protein